MVCCFKKELCGHTDAAGDEAGRLSSVEEAAGEFASGDGASCRLSSAGSVGEPVGRVAGAGADALEAAAAEGGACEPLPGDGGLCSALAVGSAAELVGSVSGAIVVVPTTEVVAVGAVDEADSG